MNELFTDAKLIEIRSLRSLREMGEVIYCFQRGDDYYIGKSNNLWQRLKAWSRKGAPQWFMDISPIIYVAKCSSELEAGIGELILINKFNPTLNTRMSNGLWREEYDSLLDYLKWGKIDLRNVRHWNSSPKWP